MSDAELVARLEKRVKELEKLRQNTLDWFEQVGVLPDDDSEIGVYDWRTDDGALMVIESLRRGQP